MYWCNASRLAKWNPCVHICREESLLADNASLQRQLGYWRTCSESLSFQVQQVVSAALSFSGYVACLLPQLLFYKFCSCTLRVASKSLRCMSVMGLAWHVALQFQKLLQGPGCGMCLLYNFLGGFARMMLILLPAQTVSYIVLLSCRKLWVSQSTGTHTSRDPLHPPAGVPLPTPTNTLVSSHQHLTLVAAGYPAMLSMIDDALQLQYIGPLSCMLPY